MSNVFCSHRYSWQVYCGLIQTLDTRSISTTRQLRTALLEAVSKNKVVSNVLGKYGLDPVNISICVAVPQGEEKTRASFVMTPKTPPTTIGNIEIDELPMYVILTIDLVFCTSDFRNYFIDCKGITLGSKHSRGRYT